jgi:hypothetical protein
VKYHDTGEVNSGNGVENNKDTLVVDSTVWMEGYRVRNPALIQYSINDKDMSVALTS